MERSIGVDGRRLREHIYFSLFGELCEAAREWEDRFGGII